MYIYPCISGAINLILFLMNCPLFVLSGTASEKSLFLPQTINWNAKDRQKKTRRKKHILQNHMQKYKEMWYPYLSIDKKHLYNVYFWDRVAKSWFSFINFVKIRYKKGARNSPGPGLFRACRFFLKNMNFCMEIIVLKETVTYLNRFLIAYISMDFT